MEDTKKLIEKYKRELMEMSRTAPARSNSPSPSPEEKPQPAKTPKIIGYVTEESGEFPSVFDKFITDAVENNDIETVRESAPRAEELNGSVAAEPSERADEEIDTPRRDLFDIESGDPEEDAPSAEESVRESEEDVPRADEPRSPQNAERTIDNSEQSDMLQGTGESISNFPVSEYSSVEEFEANNTGGGSLEFRVFAANQALPIEGADIAVTTRIDGKNHPMFKTTTNSSGETGLFTLPAPSKELSQTASNKIQPFSLYDAVVNKDGYTNVIIRDIPIFDGVQSIQRVAMLPESENGNGGSPAEEITEVSNAK